jgi:PEP-CTERM motif-containing protein
METIEMRGLLLTGAVLAAFAAPASASVLNVTGSSATGTDPVLLNSATGFQVVDNSNSATNTALRLFFAEPTGDAAPSITSAAFNGATADAFTSPVLLGTWSLSGPVKDLYSFIGCTSCNHSVNQTNVGAALGGIGLGGVTGLNVYEVDISQFFSTKGDSIDVKGTFQLGTIVLPLGEKTGKKNTFLDTAWTDAALVNVPPGGTRTGAVPEPSTWAMMGIGFALLGFAGYRRRLAPRAIS